MLFKQAPQKKGQFIGEYSLTLAIAVLAILGMSVFLKRLFNARIHAARVQMIQTVNAEYPGPVGGAPWLRYEYEPYYQSSDSVVSSKILEAKAQVNGAYEKQERTTTATDAVTQELPARNDFDLF